MVTGAQIQIERSGTPSKAKKPPKRAAAIAPRGYSIKDLTNMGLGSPPFIYEQIAKKLLVAHKLGSKTIVYEEDLEAWLASRPRAVSRFGLARRRGT